ncbi:acyltransferase [Actinotalea sp. AC32]|nr:acyltransferase [Actinotalea sp. AC32]
MTSSRTVEAPGALGAPGAPGTAPGVADRRRTGAHDDAVAAVGRRYADLEGYRGLAALGVVVYHVLQHADQQDPAVLAERSGALFRAYHGMDALVDLFFVLSAFLLALPYARSALRGEPSPSGRAFVLRRAARVVPLYVVAVTVVWAVRNPDLPGDWPGLLAALTFTQVLDAERIFATIGPAWSLAVEVQLYLLLAVGGALVCRVAGRVRAAARLPLLVGTVVAVGLASLAWKVVAWYVLDVPGDHWPTWYGLPAKLDVFALGLLLAVVVARGASVGRTGALGLRVAAFAVLAVAAATRTIGQGEHVWFHSVAAVGFVLLLASSVLGPRDRWVRGLSAAVPTFLGVVSYSLYLWHEPLLLLADRLGLLPVLGGAGTALVALAVVVPPAVLIAWVSQLLVERPTGHLKVLLGRDGRPRDYYDGT